MLKVEVMGYSKAWLALTDDERKAKRKEYNERYKSKNKEKILEYNREYRKRNLERDRKKKSKNARNQRRINKLKAIEYLGGICFDCKQEFHQCCFDFHHINPKIKDSTITRIMHKSFDNIKIELDKCVLLCAHCHRLRHWKD